MPLQSMRDAPGTQREYETIYILGPEAATENIQEINGRVRKIIEDGGGKVLRLDNWGKRKLAYEIKKHLKGIYLYWLYLGEADLVAELERNLRMLDMVIRYQSVRVDHDVNPEARPSQMDEESFLAAATTVPDEEDTYMGRGFADEGGDEEEYEAEGEGEVEVETAATEPPVEAPAEQPAGADDKDKKEELP
jgi:small subunit ribosomal protein S6